MDFLARELLEGMSDDELEILEDSLEAGKSIVGIFGQVIAAVIN